MQLCRQVLDALLPPGSLWVPADDGGLDNLLKGIADNHERAREFLSQLAYLRSPLLTPILADLEKEFGILPDATLDEATRRARLEVVKTAAKNDGSLDFLQDSLLAAGFDVLVHANNPPVDPGFFLFYAPSAICGNSSAVCGGSSTGSARGELLVNGELSYEQAPVRYAIPTDPGYWPLFFFVGGAATRNGSGELTEIADALVPVSRRLELARLILKFKPLHSWAGLSIRYI